ncbi:hypothetical protein SS1G_07013 [Sclerotinia sclerotiorum 1980 UF-70]|uniref:CNH domain-containing protein n=2 Tax=Sclerotinia sclerotiorum (strain ATCC 18683 / 1980 / Ss-1) TaxID=665079 RepID=A7ENW4_SCLS1|nr:hypothetical protein SS1G_07013 [Sclerotinia sclerotiorum 1980 UF-70]APA10477.1 hypothetical protein sscle_06g052470 [Sclerotinia sclerotiorum 1980 UF-70]EDO04530.1 hypothetical protein SS1G_07013 [Sclerotinia sclerotiorum 1980 UF-70]
MASTDPEDILSPRKRKRRVPENGPYVLRSLIEDLPLSADGDRTDIEINCVEFLDRNLYIGTSASEILHFVQIPPDPADISGKPSYILASRLPPAYHELSTRERPGVQQILLLPKVNKACILCNWTVTFYSLPELSPVFGTTQIRPCNWIGGIDLNTDIITPDQDGGGVTVLVSLNKKMRVVRIGEDPRPVRKIDFAGSTISIRRDSYACVADSKSYALLDVDRQLKIPLFPISSSDDSESGNVGGQVEDISGNSGGGLSRNTSLTHTGSSDDRTHGRGTSLGASKAGARRDSLRAASGDRSGRGTPDPLFREASPVVTAGPSDSTEGEPSPEKPLPPPPAEPSVADAQAPTSSTAPVYLKPHIVSPSPQEFLLVTGTGPRDHGVGMFVNLEGDVTRSTLDFAKYPDEIVVDGRGVDVEPVPNTMEDEEEGYVLASMAFEDGDVLRHGIEIQRWDLDPGEDAIQKFWLEVPPSDAVSDDEAGHKIGLRTVIQPGDIYFDDVVDKLRLKRFQPFALKSLNTSTLSLKSTDSPTAISLQRVSGERELFEESLSPGWEARRNEEEQQFAQRLGKSRARVVTWSGKNVWWAIRNPLALRLDAELGLETGDEGIPYLNRRKAIEMMNSLRGQEAKTETEFVSLGYIRQKIGFLILISLLTAPVDEATETEYGAAEEALLEGSLDPRVVLAIVPILRNEIIEGKTGIWVHGGLKEAADNFITNTNGVWDSQSSKKHSIMPEQILRFLRRFLLSWRRKKGFGSISNETEVFKSVDAALLIVLLQMDISSPRGPARAKSIRAELNNLVDHGVDCFERAISLFQFYNRLYVLSRLYQSRKMTEEVLGTWKRIVEGEEDEGGELLDGENEVRKYLINVRNPNLVREYGVWLASRNPKLGVQVFADGQSRVRFEPTQALKILREGAPGAVKDFLEYLVFSKHHSEYINELIAYYLDIVTTKLEESPEARAILIQTYESYRALRPPKPTYRQFITENPLNEEWWHSRLRLLQLLGGSQGSASQYDVAAILARIAPYTQELVPEIIILDGRQSHHEEALRLLTHGLGDYDTAINYCLLGGSSIYHPISGTLSPATLPTRSEQAALFHSLLAEFLKIDDLSNRVEQTSSLLERFGGWFDVGDVLGMIPDTWSVELVSGFLVSALRCIVRERSETMVVKALSGADNLKTSVVLVDRVREMGPKIAVEAEGGG